MKYIKKKESILETAPGLIIDSTEMDDKNTNTYSARAIDELVANPSISINDLPIGCGLQYYGDNLPKDFLYCDGSFLPISDYPELYEVIGDTYGSGTMPHIDGSSTVSLFRIPVDNETEKYVVKSDTQKSGTFTFYMGATVPYTAEYGMTFKDWVDSEYNTNNWYFSEDYDTIVRNPDSDSIWMLEYPVTLINKGTYVNGVSNNYIIPNVIYYYYKDLV